MNKRVILVVAVAALALVLGVALRLLMEPPAATASRTPSGRFSLIDQDGRPVTDKSWPGRWRAVYFGYTYCPDVCPVDIQRLMRGYALFAEAHPAAAAKLQPIFITIDPARDTPAVMKVYVAAFGRPLIGLTGSAAQVAAAAAAQNISYRKQADAGASDYLMQHDSLTWLYDPSGRAVTTLPTEMSGEGVAEALASWIK